MRAAQYYIDDMVSRGEKEIILSKLLAGPTSLPELDSELLPKYYSTDSDEKALYKSVLIDCAWDKVKQVSNYSSLLGHTISISCLYYSPTQFYQKWKLQVYTYQHETSLQNNFLNKFCFDF